MITALALLVPLSGGPAICLGAALAVAPLSTISGGPTFTADPTGGSVVIASLFAPEWSSAAGQCVIPGACRARGMIAGNGGVSAPGGGETPPPVPPVPLPASIWLMLTGLAALWWRARA